jgi:hypothetical protein
MDKWTETGDRLKLRDTFLWLVVTNTQELAYRLAVIQYVPYKAETKLHMKRKLIILAFCNGYYDCGKFLAPRE